MPSRRHSGSLVVHQNINHTIGVLHGARADLLWAEHAQATALDHGRAAHAEVAAPGGDDHVGAAGQRGIAGKAAPGHDGQHRHPAVQAGKAGKGGHMQAGHDGHVDIARTAATALGKQHHRQLLLQRQAQQAVGFLVVAHALGAGQHGGVIGHHHGAGRIGAKLRLVDAADAGHHAVSRGVALQVFLAAPAALGGHCQRAVLDKAARVTQVGDVLPRAAQAQRVALGHGLGPAGVQRQGLALLQAQQVGPHGRRGSRARC